MLYIISTDLNHTCDGFDEFLKSIAKNCLDLFLSYNLVLAFLCLNKYMELIFRDTGGKGMRNKANTMDINKT